MSSTHVMSIGQRLRHERILLNWSQERLAREIGTTALSINRWENDRARPRPYYRERLCQAFHKSSEEIFGPYSTEEEGEESNGRDTLLWNVPYHRNLYFTGREEVLAGLHDTLASQHCVALTALSGLGGIGKTQTALMYAYRYADEYDAVLWVRADTYESLVSDLISLAELLHLPEKDEADQDRVIAAVKRWLHGHSGWLLIFDNAEDLDMAAHFLPMRGRGHTLLTTRIQATGPHIRSIEIDKMDREEGALLVLRRAKILGENATLKEASEEQREDAEAISTLVDGLPLALDQAAAYIEEKQCSLKEYLVLYQTKRSELLRQRGTSCNHNHPHPVATTWTISFDHVERTSAVAAQLLRLCAFLHPDNIDTSLLRAGLIELGIVQSSASDEPLLLNETVATLRKYSLIRRGTGATTLTIHRLVQAVLKDAMDAHTQRQYAELTVRVVNRVFPEVEFATWGICRQYLPHALLCVALIEQWQLASLEAARLLHQVAEYLQSRAQFTEAEPLYQQALSLRKQLLGAEHLHVARTLSGLASLYYTQGKFTLAEPLYHQALAICEQHVEESPACLIHVLNELALLYDAQGKYGESEALYQHALTICEQLPDHHSLDLADTLNNLAQLYWKQSKYDEAEERYQQALAIREQVLGDKHPEIATSLNNLTSLYWKQRKYAQAESFGLRALAIRQEVLEANHPYIATSLNNLAQVYRDQEMYDEAEPLYRQALAILEDRVGTSHPHVAACLSNLALLYAKQGKYVEAETLYLRALTIFERELKPNHPHLATGLNNLATFYRTQEKYAQAEPLYLRAIAIREEALGKNHPDVMQSLYDLALLYSQQNKFTQAQPLFERSLLLHEQHLGREHPSYIAISNDYCAMLQKMESH